MTRKRVKRFFYFLIFNVFIFLLLTPFVVFYGPFNSLKLFTLETILTSRHPQAAELFLSKEKINQFTKEHSKDIVTVEPVILSKEHAIVDEINGLRVEEINGKKFKGMVMLINNPQQVKVAVSKELGTAGQRLSELVAENNAIAGINAGGFYDPNAQGNGAFPDGITVIDSMVIHNSIGNEPTNIIGFDSDGKLILEKMSAKEIDSKKIKCAVTFHPNLLIEGKPQIKGDGGWGLAPRTGIGQKADGTVILVVIDGRQPGWSMGATLRDLMNVFIEYGAHNAANLDGGSSTEMVYKGQILNKLWNIYGERYIPTAFVVLAKDNYQ
jgi:exopolysaccharide biosynthesis protein